MTPLGAGDLERKALARYPSFLFVGRLSAENLQNVLIYGLKDLENAGIHGRLVLGGERDASYVAHLSELATRLGVADRVSLVLDPDPFTRSRLYLFSQYFLVPSDAPSPDFLQDAVTHGCIPILRSGRSQTAFFDSIETTVRATYGQPEAFRATYERARQQGGVVTR